MNKIRKFESGASRNSNSGKFEYYKFINPINEFSFAKYMHSKRYLDNGELRDSDDWQKGIPQDSLLDSLTRHIKELELLHMGYIVAHYKDKGGEHTLVFKSEEELKEATLPKEPISILKVEDVLNAIRFNSEAYKLHVLNKN